MSGFLYGVILQLKLDLRSRTMLITCYAVPLLFFAVMGGIFTSIMPESRETLIQSMTVFAVTMGALIGLPPSLVEIYRSDVKNSYQANGVPLSLGLTLINISAFVHLLIMSVILYAAAPILFDAKLPERPGTYLGGLVVLIAVSLSVASTIGLAVKDSANTSMISILLFLPSTMLSGIMFPVEMLPHAFAIAGKLFPASWGYRLMSDCAFSLQTLCPLSVIFLMALILCGVLLKRIRTRL